MRPTCIKKEGEDEPPCKVSERVLLFIRRKNKDGGNRNEWLKIDYLAGPPANLPNGTKRLRYEVELWFSLGLFSALGMYS
jgi:hypothetical protein